MEGILPVVVDVDMGTLVCTMAVEEEALGEIEAITEGLPGHLPMVRVVCILCSRDKATLMVSNILCQLKLMGLSF